MTIVRRLVWPGRGEAGWDTLLSHEWLVTNGLGGYASGTVCGVPTRRFHGLLIAALPGPLGRMMMLNQLTEEIALADGTTGRLGSEEREAGTEPLPEVDVLREFRLEDGLPVWVYQVGAASIEKRLVLPNRQNSSYITYRILSGAPSVRLRLRPKVHVRPHEAPVESARPERYGLSVVEDRYEISPGPSLPPLRLKVWGPPATFVSEHTPATDVLYRVEDSRGYGSRGGLWSPGYFEVQLPAEGSACLVASTEPWETLLALRPHQVLRFEEDRHRYLLGRADGRAADPVAAELMLAADLFIVMPRGRLEDVARAQAAGDDVRTVIAGYHWFTDWGRDTMISLEGLTLSTGRHDEARWILRTFSHHVRDGLIPNLFPEGESQGLYHTADATLWYFHALDRYLQATGDRQTLRQLLPLLLDVIGHHVRGTRFGIGMDPKDGLLRQGQEEYQLTWMDAKVDGWVVTPRRGKAVEINGLWYNALRLAQGWVAEEKGEAEAAELGALADRAYRSFNERFWYAAGGHLYDVVDGQAGDDVACRPNQLLAFSLPHPVLDPRRWESVLRIVQERLLTPVGLRSLAPGHPDYREKYWGDLRSRDAAYHQGTVWAWLIGPFVDAWLKVHPGREAEARGFLQGFVTHLDDASIGSISEVFDAEPPFTPRGCVAQAWSVAEVLRCWLRTAGPPGDGTSLAAHPVEEAAHGTRTRP
jgi:predicted glycogen debranching enzyme